VVANLHPVALWQDRGIECRSSGRRARDGDLTGRGPDVPVHFGEADELDVPGCLRLEGGVLRLIGVLERAGGNRLAPAVAIVGALGGGGIDLVIRNASVCSAGAAGGTPRVPQAADLLDFAQVDHDRVRVLRGRVLPLAVPVGGWIAVDRGFGGSTGARFLRLLTGHAGDGGGLDPVFRAKVRCGGLGAGDDGSAAIEQFEGNRAGALTADVEQRDLIAHRRARGYLLEPALHRCVRPAFRT